mmetsp:Transcript_38407/g.91098  ORF Transcript_38407/g.91098 Transcript_38407/m.91098 type:complete len:215 (-) Transcript_38407:218-862(-)
MPRVAEPRPNPRTTGPLIFHTGCRGTTPCTTSPKGGRPNSSGWKSRSEASTLVHPSSDSWGRPAREGTATTRIPAATAALNPTGASSITRHSSGSDPSCLAAASRPSGEGFPASTQSPVITAPNFEASAFLRQSLRSKVLARLDVTIPSLTPELNRWSTSLTAPGRVLQCCHLSTSSGSLSSKSSSAVLGISSWSATIFQASRGRLPRAACCTL